MHIKEQAFKAELLWAMKCASCKYSFTANDGIRALFQEMFPDSCIAENYQMAHTKVSYIISHGLGPYFQEHMVNDVLTSECFYTLHFDETVTNQSKKTTRCFDKVLLGYVTEDSS